MAIRKNTTWPHGEFRPIQMFWRNLTETLGQSMQYPSERVLRTAAGHSVKFQYGQLRTSPMQYTLLHFQLFMSDSQIHQQQAY